MAGPSEHIDLTPRRERHPDYGIFAGQQRVGRVYQLRDDIWNWSINTVLTDVRIDAPLHGTASDLDQAKARLRQSFDAWLAWALTIPPDDPKHGPLDRQLKMIGVR